MISNIIVLLFNLLLFLLSFTFSHSHQDTTSPSPKNTINVTAQMLEIENANKGEKETDISLTKNVCLIYEQFEVHCGKMCKKNSDENKFVLLLSENPKILSKENDLQLTCEEMVFDTGTMVLTMYKNVKCTTSGIVFTTESCSFDTRSKILSFSDRGSIKKDSVSIESNNGHFDIEKEVFTMSKNVEIKYEDSILTCGETVYEKKNGDIICNDGVKINTMKGQLILETEQKLLFNEEKRSIKMNQVYIFHNDFVGYGENVDYSEETKTVNVNDGFEVLTNDNIRLTCKEAKFYTEEKRGIFTSDAIIEMKKKGQNNGVFISADSFNLKVEETKDREMDYDELDYFDSSQMENTIDINDNEENAKKDENKDIDENKKHILKGTMFCIEGNDVEFYSDEFKCKSDSIKYENSTLIFEKSAIIWSSKSILSGEDVKIYIVDGEIFKGIVNTDPYIILKDENEYPNQIKSDKLIINFSENKIEKALFDGYVDTILFITANNELNGINKLKTGELFIIFDKNGNPNKAFFNENRGTFTTVKNSIKKENMEAFFMKKYRITQQEQPKFETFTKKITTPKINDNILAYGSHLFKQ